MRQMKASPAYANLGFVVLLTQPACHPLRTASSPRERVDSGLTAFRLSEFATLDKIRLRHKTRLGRFITSPWRLAFLRLHHNNLTSHASFLGDRPRVAWGQAPKSVSKTPYYSDILRNYHQNGRK